MRGVVIIATAGLALVACNKGGAGSAAKAPVAGAPSSASAGHVLSAQLPTRKPGLWVQTMTRDGAPAAGPMSTMKICIDAATDAKMSLFGRRMGHAVCQSESSSRGLDGSYNFSATCTMGETGTMATKAVARGDFNSKYTVRSEADVTGAPFERMNGHHVTVVEATYAGPCPEGVEPGDVVTASGMKINMGKMMGAAAGGDDKGGGD